jgi:hypothetical protein
MRLTCPASSIAAAPLPPFFEPDSGGAQREAAGLTFTMTNLTNAHELVDACTPCGVAGPSQPPDKGVVFIRRFEDGKLIHEDRLTQVRMSFDHSKGFIKLSRPSLTSQPAKA